LVIGFGLGLTFAKKLDWDHGFSIKSSIEVEPKNFLNVTTFVIKFSGNPISDF